MYDYIFFDLDGTLTDPSLGITNSILYSLERFGIEKPERKALYPFIGPPLIDSYKKYYDFSDEEARRAVDVYREYFRDKGLFENTVYEGIPAMLSALCEAGKHLVLATSKPEEFAVRIMKHFALDGYFDVMAGALMDETRTSKDEVITYAAAKLGLDNVAHAVMIGDREHDVLGAQKNGMDSIGVLWGFGDRHELTAAHATHIVSTVNELTSLLLESP